MTTKILSRIVLILGLLLAMTSSMAQAQSGAMAGTIASAADGTVWLTDGTSFSVNDDTRIIRVTPASAADLQPGDFVAITARRSLDGWLEASIVSAFPEELRGLGEGQRPMDESNLMTNATIDDARVDTVNGGDLTISYLGTPDEVHITSATRVERFSLGSSADLQPGTMVRGNLRDGVAGFLSVN
jgi:hypothetical protein